jgi:hypothetical protein
VRYLVEPVGVHHKPVDRIQQGDSVMIPMLAMNRAKDVWGDDAMDFRYIFLQVIELTAHANPKGLNAGMTFQRR